MLREELWEERASEYGLLPHYPNLALGPARKQALERYERKKSLAVAGQAHERLEWLREEV